MSKDLCNLTIIRLQTELENSIGYRNYYLQQENYHLYNIYDMEIEQILEQIKELDK